MSQHIEPIDVYFLSAAESELVDEMMIDPYIIESNFGKTHFLGIGKTPKRVLSDIGDLLKRFRPEKWRKQSTDLIRVEAKMCQQGTRLIEVEQRPCGLGVFVKSCKRFSIPADAGVRLDEVVVLHSTGRMKKEVFASDEHLFTDNVFQWDKPRDICSRIIIRSREEEKIPHWLENLFCSDTPPRLFLLRRNADKAATYEILKCPHAVFPIHPEDSEIGYSTHIKEILMCALHDFQCEGCVVKPRRGSRAREVAILSTTDICNLNRRSNVVRSIRKNPEDYVIQPYYKGVCEAEGVCHLYRLFYKKTKYGWQYIGGFLSMDTLKESEMIVHGHERVKNILITP